MQALLPTPTSQDDSPAPPLWRLALAWWFLCSPVLWMWPSGRTLLDTVVSAAVLAPVFLWRRVGQAAAWLLVLIGAVYLGYFLAVRSAPDEYFWFTLLGSHAQEAVEYASSWRWRDALWLLAWLAPATAVAWWLARRVRPVRRPVWRRVLALLGLVWVAWGVVSAFKGDSVEATLRKINRVYPVAMFESYARQQVASHQIFAVPRVAAPTAPARADLIVLVIGESASAQRWSLLGYGGHDTNAALRPLQADLQALPVLANGNNTALALPVLLSGQGLEHLPPQGLPTYLDWARAAGFRVATFSNQSTSGTAETFFHAAYRQRSDWYVNLPDGEYDGALTPLLQQALGEARESGQPLLVTLHTYGSHPRTGKRYPPERAHWDDVYDNSIAYASELLAQWIGLLQTEGQGRRAVLLYLSDHGLNLLDCGGNYTHGSARSAYEVPLLAWSNAAFRAAQPAWAAQLAHHAQPAPEGLPRLDNRVFAATVADLLGYGGATAYPSLGAPQDAPEPLLGGQPYRARAQANACDVRAQGGPPP